ncbi:MAG: phytanoyl-CoA dioxygenase family protein [Chloroflexota bacterium]
MTHKTVSAALDALGVQANTLTDDEKTMLDQQGYLPLANILSMEQVNSFRTRLEEIAKGEGDLAGSEFHQEAGTTRLSNLVNKDPIFEICFTHPRVVAAINQVLQGDFRLSSLNSRFALPGEGLQGLHADWGSGVKPGDYQVCNSIWLLDDFTAENGATRVVPGSHNSGQHPKDVLDDPQAPHPDEKLLLAPAGTVVIFNSHTWHGGTLNRSNRARAAIHSYFCRRHQPQQTDQKAHIRPETYARLSEAARFILDV